MALTESKVIDWFIEMAKNHPHKKHLTAPQQQIFNAKVKILLEVKNKLKRVDYFGGVETLIQKASITGQKEDLFAGDSGVEPVESLKY